MRGLVLYPMNALVEDQMIRMRRALDSDIQTAWLQAYRHGHRFYFGRYTGQTPSQGLNTILARYAERSHQAARRALAGADHRAYLPRPLGAEMLTRPDMIAYPPDILITNYSMLNVMLTRSDEARPQSTYNSPGRISISWSTSSTPTRGPPEPRSPCCCDASLIV
jgi:ATP-dependent helicase YprA (DUF1998 family)